MAVGPPAGWRPAEVRLTLALDTSTRTGGVALCRGLQLLGEDTWQAGGHQTSQILPAAQRLMERAGADVTALGLVVAAIGPGSFTGLRVAASLAKGLSVALGVPICGVPTLDALAYQVSAGRPAGRVLAVVGAGRGQYYAAAYHTTAGQLWRDGEFRVYSADELRATIDAAGKDSVVAGEIDADDRLPRALSEVAGTRRPGYLAALGQWAIETRGPDETALLQPIYLRRGQPAGDTEQTDRAIPD